MIKRPPLCTSPSWLKGKLCFCQQTVNSTRDWWAWWEGRPERWTLAPILCCHCWISVYDGGSATLSLQDQISGVIFLQKVYKSLATRKKRGHSKTIKQSSNSHSKVIYIKSSFKMIMQKISFFQITCRKWQQKVQFFSSKRWKTSLLSSAMLSCCGLWAWKREG